MESLRFGHRIDSWLRPLFWLATAALLTSCGASQKGRNMSGSTSSSSRTEVEEQTQISGASIQCNTFSSSGVRLAGRVTVYVSGGVLQEDRVRVRITSLATEFTSNSSVHLKMFRWKATSSGVPELDSTPVPFTIERSDIGYPITGTMTSINVSDVNVFRANVGMSGSTVQDFLDRVHMVPTGVDYSWNALKIVLYNGTSTMGQVDMLLPTFAANPNVYAQHHPAVLSQLHPFWGQRSQNLKDADWLARSRSYCF